MSRLEQWSMGAAARLTEPLLKNEPETIALANDTERTTPRVIGSSGQACCIRCVILRGGTTRSRLSLRTSARPGPASQKSAADLRDRRDLLRWRQRCRLWVSCLWKSLDDETTQHLAILGSLAGTP